MKVTAHPAAKLQIPYPKLMVVPSNGRIVLFTSYGEGMQLNGTGSVNVGSFSKSWDMPSFQDYNGVVTLENSND